jgi:hypothetical protein
MGNEILSAEGGFIFSRTGLTRKNGLLIVGTGFWSHMQIMQWVEMCTDYQDAYRIRLLGGVGERRKNKRRTPGQSGA